MKFSRCALLLLFTLPALSGCLAKTAVGVATMPVRAGSKVVDWTTTSQSEADRNRGRAMRHQDEKVRKLQRRYDSDLKQCDEGDEDACTRARDDYARLQALRTSGVN